jgi:hypothetical protein
MKDILAPLFGIPVILSAIPADSPLWEKLLEKWGIAFVMFILFWSFSKRQQRKDDDERKKRDAIDAADKAERLALLAEIKDLNSNQLAAQAVHIAAQAVHASRLEQLTKETTRAITDAEAAHRMLTRKFKRPCIFQEGEESQS